MISRRCTRRAALSIWSGFDGNTTSGASGSAGALWPRVRTPAVRPLPDSLDAVAAEDAGLPGPSLPASTCVYSDFFFLRAAGTLAAL